MIKAIIAGGPCTGKTTLLDALKKDFPDAYFVPEAATIIIERELEKTKKDSGYAPITPFTNYPKFVPLVVDESVILEQAIPESTKLVFLDRSLIDNLAYAELNNFSDYNDLIKEKIVAANYDLAFICEPVGIFENTDVRRENAEDAAIAHEIIKKIYREAGLDNVIIPFVSVSERVKIVVDNLQKHNLVK